MSDHDFEGVDQVIHLTSGVTKTVIYRVSSIIAIHKDFFLLLPTVDDIEHNAQRYSGDGVYEVDNVYGALGTIDVNIIPALPDSYAVQIVDVPPITSTSVKLQCSCDSNGFLQSCFVLVPKVEMDTKNVEVFKQSPLFEVLSNRSIDGHHMVADHSFATIPFLLTPLDENDDGAEQFNMALDLKRTIIDHTFANLTNRFPLLDRIESDDPGTVCNMIESVCVLYNVFVANDGGNYHIE